MPRKTTCAIALASILLFSFAVLAPVAAADYTKVGVKQGDMAEYREDSDADPFTRIVLRVVSVSAPFAELNLTFYVGSTLNQSRQQNYNVSQWVDYFFLIAPNLEDLDQYYANPSCQLINSTETMTVLGMSRTVLHCKYLHGPYLEMYWDKATGLLVQASYQTSPEWINTTLTSTTAFAGEPIPLLLIIGGVAAAAIIVGIAIYLRTRRK